MRRYTVLGALIYVLLAIVDIVSRWAELIGAAQRLAERRVILKILGLDSNNNKQTKKPNTNRLVIDVANNHTKAPTSNGSSSYRAHR
jgi:hypothetical protein